VEKELSHLESAFLLLPEVPAIFPEWRRLVTAHGVSGFDVFDAPRGDHERLWPAGPAHVQWR
jgi:hypothetical protein